MLDTLFFGWGTVIRTQECRSQSPMPYRLAIPQNIYVVVWKIPLVFFYLHILYLWYNNTEIGDNMAKIKLKILENKEERTKRGLKEEL